MRLTLRTLLAYLDDTLEPSEIKAIGQKVAESDAAQELIARIKQVTRRRRLTTPALTGPNARFDANAISEYLDNELSGDLVAELEKLCLESDVHLAEIAACHQILTLVVGEPAMVPPTAKDRMYGLVRGREAIPNRRPRITAQAPPREDAGIDEPMLPGLPLAGARAPWLVWALPLAGLVLILLVGAVLAVAVYISSNRQQNASSGNVAVSDNKKKDGEGGDNSGGGDGGNRAPDLTPMFQEAEAGLRKGTEAAAGGVLQEIEAARLKAEEEERKQDKVDPPSTKRRLIANYQPFEKQPSMLLSRQAEASEWHRLQMGESVYTSDQLLAPPGYAGEVRLPSGGTLLLRGHLREYARHQLSQLLLESAVTLHDPPEKFDLDLTLHRGRIFLSNPKADTPLKVRLRALDEVWDLTLLPHQADGGTEVGVELIRNYLSGQNWNTEEPISGIYLVVLQGRVNMRVDFKKFGMEAPPGPAVYGWDSVRGPAPGASIVNEKGTIPLREAWSKYPPNTEELQRLGPGLKELSSLMVSGKNPVTVLTEEAASDRLDHRLLAINGLGALDQIPKLLDILSNDADPAHYQDREMVVHVLNRWLNRSLEHGKRLFDAKSPDKGYLREKKYTQKEAQTVFTLLHSVTEKDAMQVETIQLLVGLLNHEKQAIRELAYWQLRLLAPRDPKGQPKVPAFNSAWSEDQRRPAIDAFRKMIEDGVLPMKAPMQP
jgi:hypothetical protein